MVDIVTGFESVIEKRIREAQKKGEFDNLPGSGKPIEDSDGNVPEDLRLGYKVLKNAGYLPPEIQIRKEIRSVEEMLAGDAGVKDKHMLLKKLNFLILKLNSTRSLDKCFDTSDHYQDKILNHLDTSQKK